MEVVVKFGTKVGLRKLFETDFWKKHDRLPNLPPQEEVKVIYGGCAFVIGWLLAFTVFQETSVFKAFDRIPNSDGLIVLDHLLVGFLAGLGEKKAHDVLDFLARVFGILDKTGRLIPMQAEKQDDILGSLRSALVDGEYAMAEALMRSASVPGMGMVSPEDLGDTHEIS